MKAVIVALCLSLSLFACSGAQESCTVGGVATMQRIDYRTALVSSNGGASFSVDIVTTDGAPYVENAGSFDVESIEMLDAAHWRVHLSSCTAQKGEIVFGAKDDSLNILAFGS